MGADNAVWRVNTSWLLAVLVVAGASFALGYLAHGDSCSPESYAAAHVRSGTSAQASPNLEAEINRCIEICNATKAAGMPVDMGICLNSNISGYACAVIFNDHGHCPAYYRGTPEIVLNKECKYEGVYKYNPSSVSAGGE